MMRRQEKITIKKKPIPRRQLQKRTTFLLFAFIAIATSFAILNIHHAFFKTNELMAQIRNSNHTNNKVFQSSIYESYNDILSHQEDVTNNNNNNHRPIFVLHVGPGKTGTTTIQQYLTKHNEELKDSYKYISQPYNNVNGNQLVRVIIKRKKRNKLWEQFVTLLRTQYDRGNNVIFSVEQFQELDGQDIKLLKSLLEKWHVQVVVSYRRYHEWIVSHFNQNCKVTRERMFQIWPDQGGIRIPTFETFFQNIEHNEDSFIWVGKFVKRRDFVLDPSGHVKGNYEKHFSNVLVFNYHSDGDLVANFICQMLPKANQTCTDVRNQSPQNTKDIKNKNPSKPLHFDQLAVAAYDAGLLNQNLTRTYVSEAIQNRSEALEFSLSDFPLKCLSSNEEEALLKRSLSIEQSLLPDFFASLKGEAQHRKIFAAALKEKKFCSVDSDEVMRDKLWHEFFKSLG